MSQQDYAGKYLLHYERQHYSLKQWFGSLSAQLNSIFVPLEAEQFADVSFYQPGMHWDIYKQHARAAIIRIGQGLWMDTEFGINYSGAKAQGIGLGGYWFFDDRYSPQQQAAIIIQALQGKTFELELFVDWEVSYGGPYAALPQAVKLMQLLESAGLHVKAIGMYTGYYYFREHTNATTQAVEFRYLALHPLWLAWYATASMVQVPAPWLNWTHWQFGTPVMDWGQANGPTQLDMNKSNYTAVEFYNRYLAGIIPPGSGDPMPQIGTCISHTHVLSLRPLHQVSGASSISQVGLNVKLPVTEIWTAPSTTTLNRIGDVWAFVTYNNLQGWVGLKHMGVVYGSYTPDLIDPPPVPNLPSSYKVSMVLQDEQGMGQATYEGVLTKK